MEGKTFSPLHTHVYVEAKATNQNDIDLSILCLFSIPSENSCHLSVYENRQQEEQSHIHEVSIETFEFDVGFAILNFNII